MGSNPASLIINKLTTKKLLHNNIKFNKVFLKKNNSKILYKLNFKSIIRPVGGINIQDISIRDLSLVNSKSNKVYVKQSYLILMWMWYLTRSLNQHVQSDITKKNSKLQTSCIKFFIKPQVYSRFTITKAPMAHKTFSQEQYGFRVYSIKTSFKLPVDLSLTYSTDKGINTVLFILLNLRLNFLNIGTNLFFLQQLSVTVEGVGCRFFKLF